MNIPNSGQLKVSRPSDTGTAYLFFYYTVQYATSTHVRINFQNMGPSLTAQYGEQTMLDNVAGNSAENSGADNFYISSPPTDYHGSTLALMNTTVSEGTEITFQFGTDIRYEDPAVYGFGGNVPNEGHPSWPSNYGEFDLDSDGDGWLGIDEYTCGSDRFDITSTPTDEDNDGICDNKDERYDTPSYGEANTIGLGVDFACSSTGRPHNTSVDSAVMCWGMNTHQQLGSNYSRLYGQGGAGSAAGFSMGAVSPQGIPKAFVASAVTVGDRHACALGIDGSVYCWGDNRVGQLGIDSTITNATATRVTMPVSYTHLTLPTKRIE